MKRKQEPVRKIFVVGCPRSGTTIVQAQLASLPGVYTLAETHFFVRLLGHFDRWLHEHPRLGGKWLRRMLLVSGRTHRRLREGLNEALGEEGGGIRLPRRLTGRSYVRRFVRGLDALARRAGCGAWVEKTPDHLAYIDIIAKRIPDAYFLHVVRNGEDVLASAIDGQMRYRDRRAFRGGIDHWIARWNRSAEVHLHYARHPQHIVLPYESLLAAPERVRELLAELSGQDPALCRGPGGVAAHIADLDIEPWKQGATDGVIRAPRRKFEELFGPLLQAHLRDHLHDYREFIDELAKRQTDDRWITRTAQTVLGQREEPAKEPSTLASKRIGG